MARSARSGLRRYVRIGLLVVLGFLLLALAQDRLRARPAVLRAYELVERMNAEANDSATAPATGNGDVQAILGRQPTRLTTHGPYTVEVYSWMAGIPWRSHDYFVVYAPGDNRLVLVTHYSYELPAYRPPRVLTIQAGEAPPGAMGPEGPPFGPGSDMVGRVPQSRREFGSAPNGPDDSDRVRRPVRPELESQPDPPTRANSPPDEGSSDTSPPRAEAPRTEAPETGLPETGLPETGSGTQGTASTGDVEPGARGSSANDEAP
jgi:hypothetical protein